MVVDADSSGKKGQSAFDHSTGGGASKVVNATSLLAVDRYIFDIVKSLSDMSAAGSPAGAASLYHLQSGGHKMRARLALASGSLTLEPDDCLAAAAACELLHNASLVHDDISDGDLFRRGVPTVLARYGADIALCAGDLLLSAAFKAATDVRDARMSIQVVRSLADAAAHVISGQSTELAGNVTAMPPTLRQYLAATRAKTAPLIELPLAIGLSTDDPDSAARTHCRSLANALGLAYQILDDLDDIKTADSGQSVHRMHAWRHHRSPRFDTDRLTILRRCLWHAEAALRRAEHLAATLPAPLSAEALDLVDRLRGKAAKVTIESCTAFSAEKVTV